MKKKNLVVGGIILSILIFSLLILNLVVAEPASKGVAGAIPSGTIPTVLPPQLSSCSNPQQCREIDEVWQTIGINVRNSGEIWDNSVVPIGWKVFTMVYVPPTQPGSAPTTMNIGNIKLDQEEVVGTTSDRSTQQQCLINNFGWYAQFQNSNLENIPNVQSGTLKLESVTIGGLSREVNSVMAQPLRNVATIIEQKGYRVHNWHSCRAEDDSPKDNLYDAPRCGSLHPACLALDINPQENPHCPNVADAADWWGRVPSQEERERCKRGEIVTDIPIEIVKAFEDNGFYWGGRYGQANNKPTPDSMHFEYVANGLCCKRTYQPLSYTMTPESTFNTNPRYS